MAGRRARLCSGWPVNARKVCRGWSVCCAVLQRVSLPVHTTVGCCCCACINKLLFGGLPHADRLWALTAGDCWAANARMHQQHVNACCNVYLPFARDTDMVTHSSLCLCKQHTTCAHAQHHSRCSWPLLHATGCAMVLLHLMRPCHGVAVAHAQYHLSTSEQPQARGVLLNCMSAHAQCGAHAQKRWGKKGRPK
jgi:hypothetical protein